jgi:hypothetical protein
MNDEEFAHYVLSTDEDQTSLQWLLKDISILGHTELRSGNWASTNRRLAQWRLKWFIEHSTWNQILFLFS